MLATKVRDFIQLVETTTDANVLTQAVNFKRLIATTIHSWMNKTTKERLKRSGFVQHSGMLELKLLTTEHILSKCLCDQWTHTYTDGSAETTDHRTHPVKVSL